MNGSGGQEPGKQTSSQTQNTTSTSAPSPEIQDQLRKYALNPLQSWYTNHPTAPDYFPGKTVATPSDATQAGWQQYSNIGQVGLDHNIDPNNKALISKTLGGGFLNPADNPYLQGGLRAGFDQQNESFNNTTLPSIRSQFAAAGRTGGSEDFDTTMRGAYDLNKSQASAAAQAEAGAYSDERNRQLQTQGMLPAMQQMDLNRAGASAMAGAGKDAYQQALIQDQMNRYNYQFQAPLDYASNAASRFLGAYPGGTTTGVGTSSGISSYMPPTNPTSSMLGGLMGLGGLGLQAYSAFSDERLKEDIKPVGKLHDGQNIYSYRFLGSPKTEIGLLAQEVERVHPEAVHVDPATGFKKVHYGLATAPAGGLL
jgi:hypothetical protein